MVNRININFVFLFFCFVFLVISNQYIEGRLGYLVLVVLVVLGALKGFLCKCPVLENQSERLVTFLAFCIVSSWFYGLLRGSIFGVPEKYLFINFAGMFFYLLTFAWLIIRPRLTSMMTVFICAFFVQLVIALIAFFGRFEMFLAGGLGQLYSISELRSVYSVGFVIGFPILTVSFYSLLNSRIVPSMWIFGPKSATIIFALSLFLVVVPAMSKGFLLAVFVFCVVIFFASICRALSRMRISWLMVLSSLFLVVFIGCIFYNFFDVIVYSFSSEEVSNAKRSEQAKFILEEVTPWGAGLGAGLDSGYTRATEPYAFELSYLSVLHKLGLFSLPLFFAYFYCFYVSFKGLFFERRGVRSAFSLGLMGYAIVGIGNPILLGGLGVFFHTLSMYFLASSETQRNSG